MGLDEICAMELEEHGQALHADSCVVVQVRTIDSVVSLSLAIYSTTAVCKHIGAHKVIPIALLDVTVLAVRASNAVNHACRLATLGQIRPDGT